MKATSAGRISGKRASGATTAISWRDAWRKRELSSERAKAAANTALGSSSDAGAPKVSLTHSTSRAGWISAGAVVVVVVAVVATSPIQPEERWPRSPKADSEQAANSTHA